MVIAIKYDAFIHYCSLSYNIYVFSYAVPKYDNVMQWYNYQGNNVYHDLIIYSV